MKTYDCGHNAISGVRQKHGEVCLSCHLDGVALSKPVKVKKKLGRPVTLTPEQRQENRKRWERENKESRNKYHADRQRRVRKPVEKVRCVIEMDGEYKQERYNTWGKLESAKVYSSMPRAENAVSLMGKGNVVPVEGQ